MARQALDEIACVIEIAIRVGRIEQCCIQYLNTSIIGVRATRYRGKALFNRKAAGVGNRGVVDIGDCKGDFARGAACGFAFVQCQRVIAIVNNNTIEFGDVGRCDDDITRLHHPTINQVHADGDAAGFRVRVMEVGNIAGHQIGNRKLATLWNRRPTAASPATDFAIRPGGLLKYVKQLRIRGVRVVMLQVGCGELDRIADVGQRKAVGIASSDVLLHQGVTTLIGVDG